MQLEDNLALQRQRANSARDLLVVLLVIVVALTFALGMGDMLDELEEEVDEALVEAGLPASQVQADLDGRAVMLAGQVASAAEVAHAHEAVSRVPGVRKVDNDIALDPALPVLALNPLTDKDADEDPIPAADAPSAENENSEPGTVIAAAVDSPDIHDQAPRVIAGVEGDSIVLKGVLRDAEVMARLLEAIAESYEPEVIVNRIMVDGSVGESTWIEQVGPMIAELKDHPGVEIGFSDLGINFLGEAPSELWEKIAALKGQSIEKPEGEVAAPVAEKTLVESQDVKSDESAAAPVEESATAQAKVTESATPDPVVTAGIDTDETVSKESAATERAQAAILPSPASSSAKSQGSLAGGQSTGGNLAAEMDSGISIKAKGRASMDAATSLNAAANVRHDVASLNAALAYRIKFRDGKPQLADSAFPLLRDVVALYQRHPSQRIGIGVHTDSRGNPAANMVLTTRRAHAIREALVSYGVDTFRIVDRGYGDTRPVASNTTREGRAMNRRVEFFIE